MTLLRTTSSSVIQVAHEQVVDAAQALPAVKSLSRRYLTDMKHAQCFLVASVQRLSMREPFLKRYKSFVLDEATANVDQKRLELQHAIAELTKSKTIIMICPSLKNGAAQC